jgi:hypothetical protein
LKVPAAFAAVLLTTRDPGERSVSRDVQHCLPSPIIWRRPYRTGSPLRKQIGRRKNSGFPRSCGINYAAPGSTLAINTGVYDMDPKSQSQEMLRYEPEAWKGDDDFSQGGCLLPVRDHPTDPNVREQCRLLDLLGKINYRILSGNRVYVEVGGVVYKTLYGGYWRSVFTGIEHYLLRCEQVSGGAWTDDAAAVDLPIAYSKEGWTASGHSLSFILNRDSTETPEPLLNRLRRFTAYARR